MRNIVISRISEYLILYTDLQLHLDISPEGLESLSNKDLLDLYTDIVLSVDIV